MAEAAPPSLEEDVSPALGVRPRILIPLLVALTLLIVAFGALLDGDIRQRRADDIARTTQLADHLIVGELAAGIHVMSSLAAALVRNDELRSAFTARDRDALFRASQPIFERLHRDNRITHFYYHAPEGTNFLRVHHPEE